MSTLRGRHRASLAVLLPIVALVLAACGGGQEGSEAAEAPAAEAATTAVEQSADEQTGAAATTQPAETASAEAAGDGWESCDAEGMEVAIIPHFQSPYTQQWVDGASVAAEECNATLVTTGPQAIDTETQVRQFQDLIAKGVTAILTVAYPADVWVRPIDDAVADGVTVSTINVASPDSGAFIHSSDSAYEFGHVMGEAVAEELGPDAEGTFVTGICFPGLDVLELRVQGFTEAMNEALPNVEVTDPVDTTFDPGKNYIAWQRLAQQNPDALGFMGPCDGDPGNLLKIKRQENADWVIAGPEIDQDLLEGVDEGLVEVLVTSDPFLMGYVGIRATLEKVVLGRDDLEPGWINTGVVAVTGENVEVQTERFSSLEEGTEFSREFYAPQIDEIFGDLPAHIQPTEDYLAPG